MPLRHPSCYLLFVACALLLSACTSKPKVQGTILARVGDRVITAEEFRLNYSFGHGHLRRGENARRAYLDYMIAESLLAQEAEAVGLDTAQSIVHALHTLQEELLIEQVFAAHVLNQIEVTEAEIRDEVNKAAVSFQFRFLPGFNEDDAQQLQEQWQTQGYGATLDDRREALTELAIPEQNLTSPFVKAENLDPALLTLLQDLPINTPSQPLLYDGHWYVFEVTNIRRDVVAEADYVEKSSTYHKVVYNRKAMQQATTFVADLMEARNVSTKRDGFDVLYRAFWDWYSTDTPTRNLLHYIEDQGLDAPYTHALVAHFNEPLVVFDDQTWTIYTFLQHFTPGRYNLRARDLDVFKVRLADIVALVVRDHVMLQLADTERLNQDATLQRTQALWHDKWRYEAYRPYWRQQRTFSEADVQAYYAEKEAAQDATFYPYERLSERDKTLIRDRLLKEHFQATIDSLAAITPITINATLLDTLTIETSAINPYMTIHLLKNNSNKQPFPIVDARWKQPQP